MYYLSKMFEVPISHRLSKHLGRCHLFHGHNLKISVEIKSEKLNSNDMVMDFSELKKIVNDIISSWDHGMFINNCDKETIEKLNCDLHTFDCDPTSEVLCEYLYFKMKDSLDTHIDVFIHSISIWETENSKSTFSK
jgi:6-pyruvoyltetrahydropterin/6-carboxytetrahydropterin synthase